MIYLQFCAYGSWDSLFPISMSPMFSKCMSPDSRTLFLMTSLQYYCILGLAEIKTLHPRDKIMHKSRGFIKRREAGIFPFYPCMFPLLLLINLYRVNRQILSNHPPSSTRYPDAKKVYETPAKDVGCAGNKITG